MTFFSQRHGYTQSRGMAQVESMDDQLRHGLWNCLYHEMERLSDSNYFAQSSLLQFGKIIWDGFFRRAVDEMPARNFYELVSAIREWFMGAEWYEIYDLVEFVARVLTDKDGFVLGCQRVMMRENAAYTFTQGIIVPIASSDEVEEVDEAISASPAPVARHLTASLTLLSARKEPNYRKAVDEAVAAVEAAVRIINGKPKQTLSDGLKALKIDIHGAFKDAVAKLYGYAGDESGVRHSLIAGGRELDKADARYMLIVCSAFVNYLRAKSDKELR